MRKPVLLLSALTVLLFFPIQVPKVAASSNNIAVAYWYVGEKEARTNFNLKSCGDNLLVLVGFMGEVFF